MKEKSWKEQQTETQRGRKRYIERLEQTREANKEIEEFGYEDCTDGSDSNRSLRDRPFGS